MKKVIFLDRDGIINRERGEHTWLVEQFELLPHVIPFMKWGAQQGYEFVVITNQSGVALKLYSENDIHAVHNYLREILAKEGIFVLEIYYCPHHPEETRCLCRKPLSLMIEKAIARFNVDTANSFMIGDKERDVQAAEGAGIRGILVESNNSYQHLAVIHD